MDFQQLGRLLLGKPFEMQRENVPAHQYQIVDQWGKNHFHYGDTPEDALLSACTWSGLNPKKCIVKQIW